MGGPHGKCICRMGGPHGKCICRMGGPRGKCIRVSRARTPRGRGAPRTRRPRPRRMPASRGTRRGTPRRRAPAARRSRARRSRCRAHSRPPRRRASITRRWARARTGGSAGSRPATAPPGALGRGRSASARAATRSPSAPRPAQRKRGGGGHRLRTRPLGAARTGTHVAVRGAPTCRCTGSTREGSATAHLCTIAYLHPGHVTRSGSRASNGGPCMRKWTCTTRRAPHDHGRCLREVEKPHRGRHGRRRAAGRVVAQHAERYPPQQQLRHERGRGQAEVGRREHLRLGPSAPACPTAQHAGAQASQNHPKHAEPADDRHAPRSSRRPQPGPRPHRGPRCTQRLPRPLARAVGPRPEQQCTVDHSSSGGRPLSERPSAGGLKDPAQRMHNLRLTGYY